MNTPNHLFTAVAPQNAQDRNVQNTAGPNKILLFIGRPQTDFITDKRTANLLVVDDITAARKAITRLSSFYSVLPGAIIMQHNSRSAEECADWMQYFDKYPEFAVIPFFLYSDEVTEQVKSLARRFPFIDDIVNNTNVNTGMESKISFVNRVKKLKLANPEATNVVNIRYKGTSVNNFLKRSLDIVAASTGLLVASPFMLVIAGLIRLESKGPVFYASPRAGRNYKVFRFYKFRTMVPDADKQLQKLQHLNQYDTNEKGPVFYKVSNDPRITRLGNFLRNTSLDEIPQLFNVLRGDMSLVGNRPLPLYEAQSLTTDNWVERFLAPAGITGLWQISKRGKKEMSVEERINLDIDYAYKNSFTYDMWLMVNTPLALIQKDNV